MEVASSSNLISAYFAICFPAFTYYVTTLSCTIGRRSNPNSAIDVAPVHVDIDLGPLKSVSRLHARIEYDEDVESFVICVLGRNGAWIDGAWAKSGSRVPLSSKNTIQIASRSFRFLLASTPPAGLSAPQRESQSPSIVDVVESIDSPQPSPPSPPSEPLSELCSQAIHALGGKATLGQIRRWLTSEYEWYRMNTGWQGSVRELVSSDPVFFKAPRDRNQKGKDSLYSVKSAAPTGSKKAEDFAKDVENELIDVDGVDDTVSLPVASNVFLPSPSSVSARPGKRKPIKKSSKKTSPPSNDIPLIPAVPPSLQSSTTLSATPTPVPAALPPSSALTAEDRRILRRRGELDATIQTTLAGRPAADPSSSVGGRAILCIPIRIDISATTESTATPSDRAPSPSPLTLKNGEIVLSPKVFSHVSPDQLKQLRVLETTTVLEILRGELKKSLVEEYRKKQKLKLVATETLIKTTSIA